MCRISSPANPSLAWAVLLAVVALVLVADRWSLGASVRANPLQANELLEHQADHDASHHPSPCAFHHEHDWHHYQTMSDGQNLTTFMYFAYGSNLLTKRIHIQNPSARRVTIGKLPGYRLDFMTQSNRWHGASATIVEEDGSAVWGAIWEIDMENLQSLDDQEGVHRNIYKPLICDIQTVGGDLVACRTYQQVTNPEDGLPLEQIPPARQPSLTYLQTIQHGAEESGLPEDYLTMLRAIPDNGQKASPGILANLGE